MAKKININRRDFLKLGALTSALILAQKPISALAAMTTAEKKEYKELKRANEEGYKSVAGKKMVGVPTSCLQCLAICGIIGYVEDGRIAKIEGNPICPNNRGKICAKGQAGMNQVYDPDRILYPMKRVGKRGQGRWKRISWDQALDLTVKKLKELKDKNKPEEFMFHYGRSRAKWVHNPFLAAFGTKTIGNHTSICEGGKFVAQEISTGKHYDINDVANSKFILNIGANIYEAHTSHTYFAQRVAEAQANGVRVVTLDVRLSNTAAKSDEWVPVKPGTDSVILLAMTNVIMQNNLYDAKFIKKWTNVTVEQLQAHLKQYTLEWAAEISGVSAAKIKSLAIEFASNKPSTVITYRGAVAHYNGTMTEYASKLLDAVTGNMMVKGGTHMNVSGKWGTPKLPKPTIEAKGLKIIDGENIALPTHHVNHRIFSMIKKGDKGRPKVYMMYCYNPTYANGNCAENIEVMKDEKLLPFIISSDTAMSESTELADLILPDATYLERWDPEAPQSYSLTKFIQIRQPVIKPLGEARAFQDVLITLSKKLGIGEYLPFKNSEDYIRQACANTEGLMDKPNHGFDYIKQYGIYEQDTKSHYQVHEKILKAKDLEGTIVDEATGVIWKGTLGEKYGANKKDYEKYVGQMIDGVAYKGFKPDKISKSGKMEFYSKFLEEKGYPAMPTYIANPEHQKMKKDELILISYKVNVQIQSRSQNCKYLTEIYHTNPAWINPKTAKARNIKDGDKIKVKSKIGEITTVAKVTESVHPLVIAISHHCGHWAYGRYASGKKVFKKIDGEKKWWTDNGEHPNWIIPNAPDPISGQWRNNDTVVTVRKA